MSLGTTITGRQTDYSPSRKPIVPSSIERVEPITFDGTPERISDESQDDRPDRHAFAKSRPSSSNTCTSDTDENDYETSSEGPLRLHEGKTCQTHLLSKLPSGNLRKEEDNRNSKVSEGFGIKEKMDSRQYAYVRNDVSDIGMSTVSLPILKSIESNPTTEVKDRIISDSSFARQQKLRMIVEQTELLLPAESKIAESVKPEVCYLGKKYELNKRESLMLLPVIQNIELTEKDKTKGSEPKMIENLENPIDRAPYTHRRENHHPSRELIDILENPESSKTSFYLSPYPKNESILENKSDDLLNKKRRVVNDTSILLKIQGELSPIRNKFNEITGKVRALNLQIISNPIDENKLTGGYSIGRIDIDRGLKDNRLIVDGNTKTTQFSSMTMVGKSTKLRESCCRYSTGTSTFFHETGLNVDRSYDVSKNTMKNNNKNHPTYFKINPIKDKEEEKEEFTIRNEYQSERISKCYGNDQTYSQFDNFYYRPGSSCIHDRYQKEKGIVRSAEDDDDKVLLVGTSIYDRDFISRKSYDMNACQYISRVNADEPTDILIFGRSKKVVKEEENEKMEKDQDHHRATSDRRRSIKDLRGSSMSSVIVTPSTNLIDKNLLSGYNKESSSNITLCKKSQDLTLDFNIPYSNEKRSISRLENIKSINDNTSNDIIILSNTKLHSNEQRQKLEVKPIAVNESSSRTFTLHGNECKKKSNESLTSRRKSKVIGLPKSIEKVKIVPVFFTTGIPKPLFPFIQLEDTGVSLNSKEKSERRKQRVLMLKKKNSRKMFNCLSEKIQPSEIDVSSYYMTDPITLQPDYLSENERWRRNNLSKISFSCISPSCLSKKTTSSNAFKYASALGSICSGVARVTVSGSTISDQEKKSKRIREIVTEKGYHNHNHHRHHSNHRTPSSQIAIPDGRQVVAALTTLLFLLSFTATRNLRLQRQLYNDSQMHLTSL
ncbi:hypothetical protein M0802_003819 [Mischocyttarus mexicanus]|nr:hypothetical protein M0802_003819 [Mischocyttarus mexicanus]